MTRTEREREMIFTSDSNLASVGFGPHITQTITEGNNWNVSRRCGTCIIKHRIYTYIYIYIYIYIAKIT